MLLALVGITGVGKTYYSDKIAEKLCFNKVKTIRTRKIREGEQNGKTGLFMTQDELSKLEEERLHINLMYSKEHMHILKRIFFQKETWFLRCIIQP